MGTKNTWGGTNKQTDGQTHQYHELTRPKGSLTVVNPDFTGIIRKSDLSQVFYFWPFGQHTFLADPAKPGDALQTPP